MNEAAALMCQHCSAPISAQRRTKRYCSERCAVQKFRRPPGERACRVCGAAFTPPRHEYNRRHCSTECARQSAKASRQRFRQQRPERIEAHRAKQRAKCERDTAIQRVWKKWPALPRQCEACDETRVLDIAHRPEHRRNGAWATMANRTPEMIWILCPTCHALLDRLGYTAEQLGIRPREVAAA
jgi:predicted nucleic acid-binding Zn ribbon protein